MKSLKMTGLCLVVVFTVGMAAAASASAAWEQCAEGGSSTKYSEHQCSKAEGAGKWAWQEVTGTEEVKFVGSLRMTDTKVPIIGKVSVECAVEGIGHVGPGEHARINEVKLSSAKCRNVENCEKIEKAEARDLPWQEESFNEGAKVLQTLTSTGSGEPGLDIECKVLGVTKSDECVATKEWPESLILENKATGSELFVLATFQKSSKAKCSVGGEVSGVLAGSFAISKANGAGLRIAKAPAFFTITSNKPPPTKIKVKERVIFTIKSVEVLSRKIVLTIFSGDIVDWMKIEPGVKECELQTYEPAPSVKNKCEFEVEYLNKVTGIYKIVIEDAGGGRVGTTVEGE